MMNAPIKPVNLSLSLRVMSMHSSDTVDWTVPVPLSVVNEEEGHLLNLITRDIHEFSKHCEQFLPSAITPSEGKLLMTYITWKLKKGQ